MADVLNKRLLGKTLPRPVVQFLQQAWCGETLLNTASVTVCCVDIATMRPRPLPDHVAAKMRAA